jgi:hypothetical protein
MIPNPCLTLPYSVVSNLNSACARSSTIKKFVLTATCSSPSWLAYQFVQIIRKQLQEHDIQGRWSSLREILSVQQRVTASFQRANGGALHIRKTTRPEPELAAIYQALNLDPFPGGDLNSGVSKNQPLRK